MLRLHGDVCAPWGVSAPVLLSSAAAAKCVPFCRVPSHAGGQQVPEWCGHVLWQLQQATHANGVQHLAVGHARKRSAAAVHLPHNDSKAVDVHSLAHVPVQQQLGGHVGHSACRCRQHNTAAAQAERQATY